MLVRFITFLSIGLIPPFALGQNTDAAANFDAMLQQAPPEFQASWNASKKIAVDGQFPGSLPSQASSMDPDLFKEGMVGRLDYWQYETAQIIGPTDMLLSLGKTRFRYLWLTGFPTKGFSDGDPVRIVGTVEIGPTKQYETVLGTNKTVYTAKLLTAAELERRAKEAEESLFVTWHSKANTTVEAKFVRYIAGSVELQSRDGKTLRVKLTDFTDEDAEKLRSLIRQNRQR